MNKNGWNALCCVVFFAVLCLAGCSTQAPRPSKPVPSEKFAEANDILFTALGLVGIPYHYGGTTPNSGFDCSGLIQYVYEESANISLPRTVAEMNKLNAPTVDEADLEAGDLLIFATDSGTRPSHAGIYVGEGRFVHAPRQGGMVRMDFLSDSYWQHSYLNAKRPLAVR